VARLPLLRGGSSHGGQPLSRSSPFLYADGILLPTAQGRRYGSLPQPGLDFGRHHNFGWGPQASAVTPEGGDNGAANHRLSVGFHLPVIEEINRHATLQRLLLAGLLPLRALPFLCPRY
uniref:Uncharacterized protein n=2 Tax=Aegilops tauschii subsp. strangulata TaxID=200361 RepID=A0A453HUV0_AEGTS